MACVFDVDAAEIDGEDIEGGVGSALEDATESSDEAVGSVGVHGFEHQSSCSATAERLHECRRNSSGEVGIDAAGCETPGYASFEQVHSSASAEHADGNEDGDEVRNDADRRLEPAFGAVDEGVVDVDMLGHGLDNEPADNAEQQDGGYGGRHGSQAFGREECGAPDKESDECGKSDECAQDNRIFESNLLRYTDGDESDERGDIGSDEYGQEDVRRIGCAQLCAIGHDGGGDERESAGTKDDEHDHGVRRFLLVGVEFLQFTHGLESHRRSGIVETEHVGCEIHRHRAEDRVIFGNAREDTSEERRNTLAERVDSSGSFADFHDAHPEGEDTGESEGEFKPRLRVGESGVEDVGEDVRLTETEGLYEAEQYGQQNE